MSITVELKKDFEREDEKKEDIFGSSGMWTERREEHVGLKSLSARSKTLSK